LQNSQNSSHSSRSGVLYPSGSGGGDRPNAGHDSGGGVRRPNCGVVMREDPGSRQCSVVDRNLVNVAVAGDLRIAVVIVARSQQAELVRGGRDREPRDRPERVVLAVHLHAVEIDLDGQTHRVDHANGVMPDIEGSAEVAAAETTHTWAELIEREPHGQVYVVACRVLRIDVEPIVVKGVP